MGGIFILRRYKGKHEAESRFNGWRVIQVLATFVGITCCIALILSFSIEQPVPKIEADGWNDVVDDVDGIFEPEATVMLAALDSNFGVEVIPMAPAVKYETLEAPEASHEMSLKPTPLVYIREVQEEAAVPEMTVLMPSRPDTLAAPDAPHLNLTEKQARTAWTVWDFMISEGFSEEIAAGFVGDIYRESSLDPEALSEVGCYGLIQWVDSRLYELRAMANYQTVEVQLEFIMIELNGSESYACEKISAATTVAEATSAIAKYYERCAWSAEEEQLRIDYAEFFFEQMAGF